MEIEIVPGRRRCRPAIPRTDVGSRLVAPRFDGRPRFGEEFPPPEGASPPYNGGFPHGKGPDEDMILKRLSIQWRLALLVIGAYGLYKGARATWTHFESTRDAESVRQLVASEELILELTPRLKTLSQGVLNLRLPGYGSPTLFASSVKFTDIAATSAPARTYGPAR